MERDVKQAKISKQFDKTARKKFPYKTMYQITKELNKMLEDMLYESNKIKEKR